jgi:hypothetical protein
MLYNQSLYCLRFNDARKAITDALQIQRDLCKPSTTTSEQKCFLTQIQKQLSAVKGGGAFETIADRFRRITSKDHTKLAEFPPDVENTDKICAAG